MSIVERIKIGLTTMVLGVLVLAGTIIMGIIGLIQVIVAGVIFAVTLVIRGIATIFDMEKIEDLCDEVMDKVNNYIED